MLGLHLGVTYQKAETVKKVMINDLNFTFNNNFYIEKINTNQTNRKISKTFCIVSLCRALSGRSISNLNHPYYRPIYFCIGPKAKWLKTNIIFMTAAARQLLKS